MTTDEQTTGQAECELQEMHREGLEVPGYVLELCTGIAEYESKTRTCVAVGCDLWHRWCGPCMAAERRDHPDDMIEIRSLAGAS